MVLAKLVSWPPARAALMLLVWATICSPCAIAQEAKKYDFDDQFGSLKTISIPGSWIKSDERALPPRRLVKFAPDANSQYAIFVLDTVLALPPSEATAVHDVFDRDHPGTEAVDLTPAQIVSISSQLGNVGDNQYTNTNPIPGPRAPAFHMDAAKLVLIGGKSVLRVAGRFIDDAGKPTTWFDGAFMPSDVGDWRMLSIYVQAADPADFEVLRVILEASLKTISWRN